MFIDEDSYELSLTLGTIYHYIGLSNPEQTLPIQLLIQQLKDLLLTATSPLMLVTVFLQYLT